MKILIVTDAWQPQVNGVVRTLEHVVEELQASGHEIAMITPAGFFTLPMPTYPEIRLSLVTSAGIRRRIEAIAPEHIHIATEGPLGIAARKACLKLGRSFTTSYHTRFPEYLRARVPVPLSPSPSSGLASTRSAPTPPWRTGPPRACWQRPACAASATCANGRPCGAASSTGNAIG